MVSEFQAMVRDFPHYLASAQHRSAGFRQISDRFHLTGQIPSLLGSLPGKLTTRLWPTTVLVVLTGSVRHGSQRAAAGLAVSRLAGVRI